MATLRIEIQTDNAVFDDGECQEVSRILRALADEYDAVLRLDLVAPLLLDLNGNAVGVARVLRAA
jgi:hypothetical protein